MKFYKTENMPNQALENDLILESWERMLNFGGQVSIGEINPNKEMYMKSIDQLKGTPGAPNLTTKKALLSALLPETSEEAQIAAALNSVTLKIQLKGSGELVDLEDAATRIDKECETKSFSQDSAILRTPRASRTLVSPFTMSGSTM